MFFCSNAYIFSKKRFEKDVFVVGGIISWLCNSYVDNSSDGETTVYGTRGRRKIVFLERYVIIWWWNTNFDYCIKYEKR